MDRALAAARALAAELTTADGTRCLKAELVPCPDEDVLVISGHVLLDGDRYAAEFEVRERELLIGRDADLAESAVRFVNASLDKRVKAGPDQR